MHVSYLFWIMHRPNYLVWYFFKIERKNNYGYNQIIRHIDSNFWIALFQRALCKCGRPKTQHPYLDVRHSKQTTWFMVYSKPWHTKWHWKMHKTSISLCETKRLQLQWMAWNIGQNHLELISLIRISQNWFLKFEQFDWLISKLILLSPNQNAFWEISFSRKQLTDDSVIHW